MTTSAGANRAYIVLIQKSSGLQRERERERGESMDLWNKARVFAEETARKSQEISIEAANKSQDLFITKGIGAAKGLFSKEFITEASKKSKELAVEASKKAEQLKIEALKGADRIKSLAGDIEFPIPISKIAAAGEGEEKENEQELNKFGVTKEITEFVNGITISTFRDFTMEDEPVNITDQPAVSNVRQDLNEWQARHATLVLSMVKEISNFRYELCPRYMKERKFWQIYFILVKSYVAPYEKMYFESKDKLVRQEKEVKVKEAQEDASTTSATVKDTKLQTKTSGSSNAEHDLDAFLLGDLGSSDDELDVEVDDF